MFLKEAEQRVNLSQGLPGRSSTLDPPAECSEAPIHERKETHLVQLGPGLASVGFAQASQSIQRTNPLVIIPHTRASDSIVLPPAKAPWSSMVGPQEGISSIQGQALGTHGNY